MDNNRLRSYIKKLYGISSKINIIRNKEIPLKQDIRVNSAMLSTLDVISRNPDMKMSEISSSMGITKGAVSQVASKLQQMHLVNKCKSNDNAKDIYLVVTDEGKKALAEYYVLHDRLYDGVSNILSQYDEKETETIWSFLIQTDQFLGDFKKDTLDNIVIGGTKTCDK